MKKEYNKQYEKINKKAVLEVRRIIKKGLFKSNLEKRLNLLKELNKRLSKIYKVKTPTIKKISLNDGCYCSLTKEIFLNNKLSLVTYLHEFKHHLQHEKEKTNNEEIARGWSLSLFHKATPKLFENAVKKGLVIHQKDKKKLLDWFKTAKKIQKIQIKGGFE